MLVIVSIRKDEVSRQVGKHIIVPFNCCHSVKGRYHLVMGLDVGIKLP